MIIIFIHKYLPQDWEPATIIYLFAIELLIDAVLISFLLGLTLRSVAHAG